MDLPLVDVIQALAFAVQLAGSLVIGLSGLYAILAYGKSYVMGRGKPTDLQDIRIQLGRGLVLGLEFLIGADILRTVATPTFEDIGVLGAIIIIRTILSLTIEYELGRLKVR